MVKKLWFFMSPFFIYSIVVFLLRLPSIFIPNTADIMWLWIFGFYFPYLFGGIYVISFVLGLSVQKRSNTQKFRKQLLLSFIFLFVTLFNLLIPTWRYLSNYTFLENISYTVYPALGTTLLFLLAQIVKMYIQKSLRIEVTQYANLYLKHATNITGSSAQCRCKKGGLQPK